MSASIRNLTKRYGPVLAVDDLSFDVGPGQVTGFLGPNGSGKTTTLRILLGLAVPTAGTATIDGLAYHQLPDPVRRVGAALDSNSFHPGRSAAQHLRVIATATGLPRRRVDEVLALTGLSDAAGRRVGGFSLGMRQRLSPAGALLGDPGVLVFDEPLNGLDPDGIRWLRGLLRELAAHDRHPAARSGRIQEALHHPGAAGQLRDRDRARGRERDHQCDGRRPARAGCTTCRPGSAGCTRAP